MTTNGDPTMEPVRCLGNHNADRRAVMPRAHHKFLVFCDYVEGKVEHVERRGISIEAGQVIPRKVWTGSYWSAFRSHWIGVRSMCILIFGSGPSRVHPQQ